MQSLQFQILDKFVVDNSIDSLESLVQLQLTVSHHNLINP
jgi:hypothetical protein